MKSLNLKVLSLRNRLCWLVLILPLIACTPAKQESPTSPSIPVSATAKVSVESGTASVSSNKFTVKIYVENVSDLYDGGFDLTYTSSVATPTFNAGLPSTSWALAQDGTGNMSYQVSSAGSGKVRVAITRLAPALSVSVSSKTLLCEIEFQKVAAGTLNLTFAGGSSDYLSHTTVADYVSGVTWEHGVVTVP